MKNYLLTILTIALAGCLSLLKAQNVYLPDANFKAALVNNAAINTNGDTAIQVSEATAYTGFLNVANQNISDMTGIGDFTVIDSLDCSGNQLTILDLMLFSLDSTLTYLDCSNNNLLSNLFVYYNTALKKLRCSNNQLSDLHVEGCQLLTSLVCNNNQLTSLNLYYNTALKEIDCSANMLTSLNLSFDTSLVQLTCNQNQLIGLNIQNGHNTNLTFISSVGNPNLTCIQVDNVSLANSAPNWFKDTTTSYSTSCAGNSPVVYIPDTAFKMYLVLNSFINTNADAEIQVTEAASYAGQLNLDGLYIFDLTGVEAFTSVDFLDCSHNQLTSLNVSANTALTHFDCSTNQLTSLNVSPNTALTYLDCSSNQLTSLNVSSNNALTELNCNGNQISNLNVSNNTALAFLFCYDNQLLNLDVTANTALTSLSCSWNQQLTSLNLQNGHNILLTSLYADNNTYLNCIQVDDISYAYTASNWDRATWTSYSTNCNYPPTNCYAHFTMSPDTIPQTWYALNQCTGNGTINYVWNWGDGTPFDSTANPSHTYTTAGYYNICVSITDSAGCTNSYCDSSIYINKSFANAVINVSVVNQLPSYIITGMESISKAKFTVYPNPAKDKLYIECRNNGLETQSQIIIFDLLGNELLPQNITTKLSNGITNLELSISNLPKGVYFVKVGSEVKKIIKE